MVIEAASIAATAAISLRRFIGGLLTPRNQTARQ
jgi:hypothetical protein